MFFNPIDLRFISVCARYADLQHLKFLTCKYFYFEKYYKVVRCLYRVPIKCFAYNLCLNYVKRIFFLITLC